MRMLLGIKRQYRQRDGAWCEERDASRKHIDGACHSIVRAVISQPLWVRSRAYLYSETVPRLELIRCAGDVETKLELTRIVALPHHPVADVDGCAVWKHVAQTNYNIKMGNAARNDYVGDDGSHNTKWRRKNVGSKDRNIFARFKMILVLRAAV